MSRLVLLWGGVKLSPAIRGPRSAGCAVSIPEHRLAYIKIAGKVMIDLEYDLDALAARGRVE